jgi:hypothetical protein
MFFIKKSKRSRFSKKKKKQKSTSCNWVFDWVAGSHQVFSSPVFSSTRPGSSPKSAESGIDPLGWAGRAGSGGF